jgi:predicted nucleotidyltransferase
MVAFSAIQAAAMRIAEHFKPQKIILFGSYAYGKPNEDSDVDYMVLMRGTKSEDRALDIRMAIKFDFPVDLLVRSPAVFERRIAMGDFFLMDIKEKGKVLYEAARQSLGLKV